MLWSDFKSMVLVDMPVNANQAGIATGNPNFLQQQLLYGAIKVQQAIRFYQGPHETVYGAADLVLDGVASVGALPQGQQCRPLDAAYKRVGRQCVSQPLVPYSWGNRADLTCGNPRIKGCQFYVTFDPWGQQFTVFPKVGNDNQISLTWAGVKTSFQDTDETPFEADVVEAVGLFVKAKISRLVDHDLAEYAAYMNEFRLKLGWLFADTRERIRMALTAGSQQPANKCANSVSVCHDKGSDCWDPEHEHEDTVEFCAFGDSGDAATIGNTQAVSILVKSIEPDFVLQLGDINYPHGDPVTFQDNFVKYYGLYAPESLLFAFGNHDIETDGGAAMDAYFTKQAALNGGKRYYDYIPGARRFGNPFCHIFVLDTNLSSPAAEQFAWLQQELAASTDLWNIVAFHEPPYSSDVGHFPGNTVFRQPFKDWGAHAVICGHGHGYERILTPDGYPLFVCGLGGAPKRGFVSPPVTGSQFRYNDFYGSLYITARRDRLQINFFDTRGESIDTLMVERPDLQSVPP